MALKPSKWYCQPLALKQAHVRAKMLYARWRRNPICWKSHVRRLRREASRRAYRRRYMLAHPDPPAPPVDQEQRCIEWCMENDGPNSRLASSLADEVRLWTTRGRSRW